MSEVKKLGKYELQSVLGKGAMGVVYKAFDPNIERTVAIKTVRMDLVDPDLIEQFIGRFKNEARAAGRLTHPNIVAVYEYGEDDTVTYIAMEYVEGHGLREHLNRRETFDFAQLVRLMIDGAAAGCLDCFGAAAGPAHDDWRSARHRFEDHQWESLRSLAGQNQCGCVPVERDDPIALDHAGQ